jgi:hypothetical protein
MPPDPRDIELATGSRYARYSITAFTSLTKSTAKSFDQRASVRFVSINDTSVSVFVPSKYRTDDCYGSIVRLGPRPLLAQRTKPNPTQWIKSYWITPMAWDGLPDATLSCANGVIHAEEDTIRRREIQNREMNLIDLPRP